MCIDWVDLESFLEGGDEGGAGAEAGGDGERGAKTLEDGAEEQHLHAKQHMKSQRKRRVGGWVR